jgi:hypothetical protein
VQWFPKRTSLEEFRPNYSLFSGRNSGKGQLAEGMFSNWGATGNLESGSSA